MPKALPQSSDFLNNPDHSLLHRIISVDTDAPESTIDVQANGDVIVPGRVLPNAVLLDTTPSTITPTPGQIYWDTQNQTAALDLVTGVTLQLGQEQYVRVVNKTGVQLNDGDVVRLSGAQGNRPTAVLAQANTFTTSVVIGVVTHNIAINDEGFVTTLGVVNGFDTSVFSGAGAYLYLSSTTPGKLVDNITTPVPEFAVPVAIALNKTNNGAIYVNPFYPRSTDGTLAGNSNSYSPSEKAVKTYADTKLPNTISTDNNFPTGFCVTNDGVNTADTTMSFNTTTKIFTLAKVNDTFSFYCGGTKFTKSADQTVDLTSIWANNTLFFIYESSSGVLSAMTTPWDITGNAAPVATVLWNGTSAFAIIADERHSSKNNNAWHEWAHDAIGAKISPTDFGITTLNSTSTVIQGGELLDEDIHNQVSTQTDSVRVVYRTGSTPTYADTLSAVTASVVGGALKYDNAGTLTSVSSGYYIRNIVLVSNVQNASGPIVCRVAQTQWNNINDARNSPPPSTVSYLSNESRELYSVIWQNVGGTPTLIEYTDYRSSPTLPNGFVAKTPTYVGTLADTQVNTPAVDDVIKWNGIKWINSPQGAVSAGSGIEFYYDDTKLIPAGTGPQTIPLATLLRSPSQVGEEINTVTVNASDVYPLLIERFKFNTALGGTQIDAGAWTWDTYNYVDTSVGTTTMPKQVCKVMNSSGTIATGTGTVTGSGTSRTFTVTGGTPFVAGDANADKSLAGYVETPNGIFQITGFTSSSEVTILTLSTYTNETSVAYSVHRFLFLSAGVDINNTVVGLNTTLEVHPAYTIEPSDKLSITIFGKTTRNGPVNVSFVYGGTTHYSHVSTPLITRHNDLSGIQGGSSTERYHISAAEASVVANTSGINTGDNSVNSSSAPVGRNLTINGTTYDLSSDRTWTISTGISWSAITADQSAVADNGYLANKGTLLTLTLPLTCAVGKTIRIAGMNSGLWKIAQNANQYIKFGNQTTSTGVGGYLASVLTYDAVELICIVADTGFVVASSVGNITIV